MPTPNTSIHVTLGRVLIACACLFAARVAAQQVNGSARISGTIVSNATPPSPVRGAVVTLNGVGANGRSAVTDDQGRFAFTGLPAGRFTVSATKPAWLSNAYGAKSPGRPGTAIVLAADQAITGITLVLPHGAAISGVVRSVSGDPAAMLPISVIRVDKPAAPADVLATADAVTDDRGAYRVYGLVPGTYVVSTSSRALSNYSAIAVPSAAEMEAAFREQQARANNAALPPRAAAPPVTLPLKSYAPTYYPGTAVGSEATRITLDAGDDRQGVDFSIVMVPIATLEGRVVSAIGPVPEMSLALQAEAAPMRALALGIQPGSTRTGVNGNDAFKLTNVAPGHYTLVARSSNTQTTVQPAGGMSSRSVDPSTVSQQWGSIEVDVHGEDLGGLTMQLQPALTLRGHIVFDGTTPAPQNMALVRVSLRSDTASMSVVDSLVELGLAASGDSQTVSAAARTDGTFQLDGIVPGRFHLNATAPGGVAGWWLQSAMVGSRDAIDSGLDLAASASDVVLTFSDKHTEIAGVIQNAAGQPAPELVVVAFPANASLRSVTRRLQSARPSSDGRFTFTDLPPGDYVIAALADDDNWQAASTLEQLAASGETVTLADGARIVRNLKFAR